MRDTPATIALFDRAERACDLLNRTEFLGHPVERLFDEDAFFMLFDPGDRGEHVDALAQLRDAFDRLDGTEVLESTHTMRAADGGAHRVHVRWSPLGRSGGPTLLGLFT